MMEKRRSKRKRRREGRRRRSRSSLRMSQNYVIKSGAGKNRVIHIVDWGEKKFGKFLFYNIINRFSIIWYLTYFRTEKNYLHWLVFLWSTFVSLCNIKYSEALFKWKIYTEITKVNPYRQLSYWILTGFWSWMIGNIGIKYLLVVVVVGILGYGKIKGQ